MKKLILLLSICLTSCVIPEYTTPKQCCDERTYIPTHYQPTKVVIIKKDKPTYKKRNIKVKVNKHRKRK